MHATTPTLAIITVNYGTSALVIDMLTSLIADDANLPSWKLFIIENASPDNSAEVLAEHIQTHALQDRVELIIASGNLGYAGGNNLALQQVIEQSHYQHAWLLNPDTRVHPNAATELIRFLDNHPDAGITGSRLEDEDGTAQTSAFRFPGPMSEFLSSMKFGPLDKLFGHKLVPMPLLDTPHEADWLAGASVMMRADMVRELGLMDDDYFLYFEELDYCEQARAAGWGIYYVPESRVFHAVGAASGISDLRKKAPRRPSYWFDSRRRYMLKHRGKAGAIMADIAHISGYATWRLRRKIQNKPDVDPPKFLGDLCRNSTFAKGFSLPGSQAKTYAPIEPNGLWQQLKSDWLAHDKDWTRPGFRAIAFYRFGVWRMSVNNKFLRAPLSIFYRYLYRHARNVYGIEVPYSSTIGQRVVIEHQGGIVIHGNAVIGNDCIIRQGVTLGNRSLDTPFDAPVLGERVNVGAGAKLLGKLHIGDDASIGANAVVLKDVPAKASALGVPAQILIAKITPEEQA